MKFPFVLLLITSLFSQETASPELRRLIRDLAPDGIDLRNDAEEKLKARGAKVVPVLLKLAKGNSPEVSSRAASILRHRYSKLAQERFREIEEGVLKAESLIVGTALAWTRKSDGRNEKLSRYEEFVFGKGEKLILFEMPRQGQNRDAAVVSDGVNLWAEDLDALKECSSIGSDSRVAFSRLGSFCAHDVAKIAAYGPTKKDKWPEIGEAYDFRASWEEAANGVFHYKVKTHKFAYNDYLVIRLRYDLKTGKVLERTVSFTMADGGMSWLIRENYEKWLPNSPLTEDTFAVPSDQK